MDFSNNNITVVIWRKVMTDFHSLPKTIKKTIRYLHQDASVDKLVEIQKMINDVIQKRLAEKQS